MHSCVKSVTPDQYRAVKIENSVMKKCHEENITDENQVYIKILEAIGENGLMKVVRSPKALASQYLRMLGQTERKQHRLLDVTRVKNEDSTRQRHKAKQIEASAIDQLVKESVCVNLIYQKVIQQLSEAGLYEHRTRKNLLLIQIHKAVTTFRTENKLFEYRKKEEKVEKESKTKLEKELVPEEEIEELLSCDVCSKTFLLDVDLRKHLRYHEREARCLRSGQDYSKPVFEEFVNDKINEDNSHLSIYSCEICTSTFISEAALELHILYTHKKDKVEFVYKCVFCNKPFTNYASFKTHENMHNKTKDFACDICNKPFFHEKHLERHIRKHTGEKPFSCEVCGLKFSHENSLKRHGRIHQKDCKCRFCGKQFSDKSLLKIHQIMHEKELPHHCSICKKGFKNKSNMNTHKLTHQRKKCTECRRKFYEDEMKEHMITEHNKQDSDDPDDEFNDSSQEDDDIAIQEEFMETTNEENSANIDIEDKDNEDSEYITEEQCDVDVKEEPIETNPTNIKDNDGYCDVNIKDEPIDTYPTNIAEIEHIEVNPDIKLEIKDEPTE